MLAISKFGVADRQLTDRERWVCFIALFFFSFTAAFNLFKASPAISFIGDDLGIAAADVGYIMSFYSIAVVVFAYPGMLIMQKIGVKAAVFITSVLMILGSFLGSIATSAGVFLASRAIEGCAYGIMCVVCPNIMPRLFPADKQGLVMGIWSQCVPVGTIIAFFSAPVIFDTVGWRPIWYVSLAMEAVAFILILTCVKMPRIPENELVAGNPARRRKPGKNFMFAAVAMAIIFSVWVYDYVINVNTLYPTFLQQEKGLSVFDSSMLPNVTAFISIPLGIIAGVVTQRFHARKKAAVFGYALLAVIMFFCAYTPGDDMTGPWVFAVLLGICQGCCVTCTRANIPALAPEPKKTDLALATMSFSTGVAMCLGGVASNAVASIGWIGNAHMILAPAALAAAVLVAVLVTSDKRVKETRAAELRDSEQEAAEAPDSAELALER